MRGGSRARQAIGRGRVVTRLFLVCALTVPPTPIVTAQSTTRGPALVALASVPPQITDRDGHPLARPPGLVEMAAPVVGTPPPASVSSPGPLKIPPVALKAYIHAERLMAASTPGCGVSWNLLAGIGYVESTHAFGGATDPSGNAVEPIHGPALDGTLPGNEVIVEGHSGGRTVYARAMGPMQFLPATWRIYTADADGDGRADPQNLFDASLAAARYLCDGALNLRDRSQLVTAVLRYNNSMAYTLNVLGWATAYATGVPPVNLPSMTGPARSYGTAPMVGNRAGGNAGSGDSTIRNPGAGGGVAPGPAGNIVAVTVPEPPSPPRVAVPTPSRLGTVSAGPAGNGATPRVTVGNGRQGGAR
jgi:hypothetical protein